MLVDAADLRVFAARALTVAGARERDAAVCAEVLVSADLGGVDSHGVTQLSRYVSALRSGSVNAAAKPEVVREVGAVAVVDADNGLGQPALRSAVDLAVHTARRSGVAAVALRRSNHVGPISWYVDRAADAGAFAMVMTNTIAMVAPTNTSEPFLGTNPVGYAVPASGTALSFDAATSVVPRGRLEQSHRDAQPIPSGWAVDLRGRSVVSPGEVLAGLDTMAGHSLLPIGGAGNDHGGHKGFGVSLLVELLCGPLAGAAWARHVDVDGQGRGQFVLCMDVAAFGEPVEIRGHVDQLREELRDLVPIHPETPVRAPGDRRHECVARRSRFGVPLPPPVVEDLRRVANSLGIPWISTVPGGTAPESGHGVISPTHVGIAPTVRDAVREMS